MDTEIKNAVSATDQDAQYDDKAKRLLGNKIILAHILVKTVDEKLEIIKTEYHVPVDDELRKDVSALCNLSQGIRDNTLVDVIMTMYENNFTLEQIAVATKKA